MNIDLTQIQALLRILEKRDVTEFEFEDEHVRLRLVRGAPAVVTTASPQQIVAAPAAVAPTTNDPREESESDYISSPFVGTFYAAPGPGKPPFVTMGEAVKEGQTVCIVEAMKLMNEIETEFACVIEERLMQDGQPVEFGTRLFRVRRM